MADRHMSCPDGYSVTFIRSYHRGTWQASALAETANAAALQETKVMTMLFPGDHHPLHQCRPSPWALARGLQEV